jgi:molybdenum cofactor cytidylyltransferase
LGQSKALVEFDGSALVTRSVRNLLSLNAREVIVVSGFEPLNILKEIEKYPVKAACNENWARGMGGSIATGARRLTAGSEAVLILLCDQWKVDRDDLSRLVNAWSLDISEVFSAKWGDLDEGAFGPPVIFPNWLFSELESLDSEQGARKLIRQHWQRVTFVEMENAAFDLDEPADLNLLREFEATLRR